MYAHIQGVGVTYCHIYNNFDGEEVGTNNNMQSSRNMKFPTAVCFQFWKGLCDHVEVEQLLNVMNGRK